MIRIKKTGNEDKESEERKNYYINKKQYYKSIGAEDKVIFCDAVIALCEGRIYDYLDLINEYEDKKKNMFSNNEDLNKNELNSKTEKVKNLDLFDSTENEAKELNKLEEWDKIIKKCFKLNRFIPRNLKGNNLFLYESECKLQGKNYITPNVIIELYNRYSNCTFEEAKEDLENRLKQKHQKK